MKILFVFVLPSGGVDTLNRMRAAALAARGIECHFLYFSRGNGAVNLAGYPVYYTPNPDEIGDILRRGQYAAMVVVSYFLELEMFRVLGYRGPIIFEIQGFGPEPQARQAMTAARPYLNAHADALLHPHTPAIGRILEELYPHKPIFAFHNPFDARGFRHVRLPRYRRPVLAWIGRLEDNKNWRDFLAVTALVVSAKPDAEAWMFEDPDLAAPGEREAFERMVEEYGLGERVRLVRHIAHRFMPAFYSRIGDSGGLLLMTSKSEGAPYAALEALSCRCPVLTTDSGGVRSAVIDGETGLYYGHGDIGGGAAQALRLMTDQALRRRLIRLGRRHVRRQFTYTLYADHFVRMLRELGVKPC